MDQRNSSVLLPLTQIDELSHALEIERELVLRTQENYKKLKKKFLELSEESQSRKVEMETKFDSQNRQIEILERVKEELTEENRRLHDESLELKAKIDEIAKAAKAKEDELRQDFSNQIEELLRHASTEDNNQLTQNYGELWKKELLKSESRVQDLLAEIRTIQSHRYEELAALEAELRKERQKCVELKTTLQRMILVNHDRFRQTAELESARSLASVRQNMSIALRSDINRQLKEAMEKEVAWLSKEEDFHKILAHRTTSFEEKVADLERATEEKTNLIADHSHVHLYYWLIFNFVRKLKLAFFTVWYCNRILCLRRNFEDLRTREASAIVEAFSKNNDEEKIRLEGKVKSLSLELEQQQKASRALVEELERERDKLEMTVAELKKSAMSCPPKLDELQCLRKAVEEKEEQLSSVTRRYRQLLHQVDSSLKHLEKQQRRTSVKLEEAIIPSFLHNLTI